MPIRKKILAALVALAACFTAVPALAVDLSQCQAEYDTFVELHTEYLGDYKPGEYFDDFESGPINIPFLNSINDIDELRIGGQTWSEMPDLPAADEFEQQWNLVSRAHKNVIVCLYEKRAAEVEAEGGVEVEEEAVDPSEPEPISVEEVLSGCDRKVALDCLILGYMYRDGKGVEADHIVSVSYFRKACDYHDPSDPESSARGCYILASYYESGDGMQQDLAMALELYDRGCQGGVEESCSQARIVRLAAGEN